MADLAKKEATQSERFMLKVINEFGSSVGEVALTHFQKRLAQNYFIAIDGALKSAEEKRLKKTEKYRDLVPVTWANVNMEKLAQNVVAMARIGYDPAQKNHINMMPFKNNSLQKYDIVFIEGYRGLELKAKKYALDPPDYVIVELVCKNDHFKSIKRDATHHFDHYEFDIVSDFDRGEIIGGFYYHVYTDNHEKNKLVVMPMKEILKRKPDHASPEFWGGQKDVWKDGKKSGVEEVEGWFEKMAYKTIYRAAYADITIDSQKIDSDYLALKQMESDYELRAVEDEIDANANKTVIDVDYEDIPNPDTNTDPTEVDEPNADKKASGPDF